MPSGIFPWIIYFLYTWKKSWKLQTILEDAEISKLPIQGVNRKNSSFTWIHFYVFFKVIPEFHGNVNYVVMWLYLHSFNPTSFILFIFILVSMSTVPIVKATANGSLKANQQKELSSFRLIETTQRDLVAKVLIKIPSPLGRREGDGAI